MIDNKEYPIWHDIGPLGTWLAEADPRKFLVEGSGCRVRDEGGRWYLDARSSLWNATLGYDHPGLISAITGQVRSLPVSQLIRYDRPSAVAVEYGRQLREALPGCGAIRFANSGSQACETAVLLSRSLHRHLGNYDRTHVIAMYDGYHGTGPGASALTGQPIIHSLSSPLSPDVHHIHPPYCFRCPWQQTYPSCGFECLDALAKMIETIGSERIAAIIIEPILGSGGIVVPDRYLSELREMCGREGIHLIFDEVTTGMGRVGAITRAEQVGTRPDLIVLGKGLAAGYVPLAAVGVSEELYDAAVSSEFVFPQGSTTDGSPLAMAAGIAVLEALREGVLEDVAARGSDLEAGLRELAGQSSYIGDVRGAGLLQAVELVHADGTPWSLKEMWDLRLACENDGVLINTTNNCIMLLPPLIISKAEVEEVLTCIATVLS